VRGQHLRLLASVPETWCLAPGVEAASVRHRCTLRGPTSNRHDDGVVEMPSRDARQHHSIDIIAVAECASPLRNVHTAPFIVTTRV